MKFFEKLGTEPEISQHQETGKISEEIEAGKFKEFYRKEKLIIGGASGFLMDLAPEKYKKKMAAMLAAFSIFAGASSAFAEGGKPEIKEKLFSKNYAAEAEKEDENKLAPAGLNWKKMVDKITVAIEVKSERLPEFKGEVTESLLYDDMIKTEFYKDFSAAENNEEVSVFASAIYNSQDAKSFFEFLNNQKENFSDRQKIMLLQDVGVLIKKTYDYDMLESNEFIAISDDAKFQAIKNLFTTGEITKIGICGDIHAFLTKTAESLGMEAWLQSGLAEGGIQHIWSGMIVESGGKKQIVFLDYDDIIPTGTLNYRDARGIYERYAGSIDAFNSFVGNEKEILFLAESRAQKIIKKATGFENTEERLGEELVEGKFKKEEGLEINLSPEIKEIKINKNTFGLMYFNFQDFHNNPYQSLEDLNALRGRLNLGGGERLGLEANATVLHMNIKDLYEGSIARNEIITRLAADYIDSHKFTKNKYGQFVLNFGATLQAGLRLPLDQKIEFLTIGGMSEAGAGMRLIYINPNETGKFYIGAQEMFRGQLDNFQDLDLMIKESAQNFIIGAEFKVFEGKIINLEATKGELDWGKSFEIKGGLAGEKLRGEIGYEKKTSEYERFVPSSEKIEAEISYKGGPKWEMDFIGSKTTEEYKDAKSEDIYNMEVKLRVFLW